MKNVIVIEGWRYITHSYAMVNQWQLLSFLTKSDVEIRHVDAPYLYAQWLPTRGLFKDQQESSIHAIQAPGTNDIPIAKYRIKFPYDLSCSDDYPHFIFGTCEHKKILTEQFKDINDAINKARNPEKVFIITPSLWSQEGFLKFGFRKENVIVIPHGFSPDLFNVKTETERQKIRAERRLNSFLFTNVSALSENKGIHLLLQAFAHVIKKYPNSKLCIKGSDAVFRSKEQMEIYLKVLEENDRRAVIDRLVYIGSQISNEEIANLYHCSDAYVCPYLCEGFNIPALEAAACGLPVIYTKGGPTDEFLDPSYHLSITSTEDITDDGVHYLNPDFNDLVLQMISAIESKTAHRERAEFFAPRLVETHSWDSVVNKLLLEIKSRC